MTITIVSKPMLKGNVSVLKDLDDTTLTTYKIVLNRDKGLNTPFNIKHVPSDVSFKLSLLKLERLGLIKVNRG